MDWAVAGPYVTGVIAAAVAVLVAKMQNRGRPENALIDQLQEELARHSSRIGSLESEQTKAQRRERIRDDYINKLRRHIEDGNPPPPPVWPDGLYD
jgi:hypothetical protein